MYYIVQIDGYTAVEAHSYFALYSTADENYTTKPLALVELKENNNDDRMPAVVS